MPLPLSVQQKRRLAYAIALVWLLVVAFGFWFFSGRWTQPFGDTTLINFSTEIAFPPPDSWRRNGKPLIVHFLDPQCPCNRFAEPQVDFLEEKYDPKADSMRIYATRDKAGEFRWVPASPAVAVWDAKGQLAYLGPHNAGAFCGQGEDLVGRILHQLLVEERNPRWLNWQAVGCFCPWPEHS